MKIGIVTYHRSLNCGAVLQAYALQTFLEKNFDVQASIVDCRVRISRKRFAFCFAGLKRFLGSVFYSLLTIGIEDWRRFRYDKFSRRHLHYSKFFGYASSDVDSSVFDAFCAGSDQIWNPVLSRGNMLFFLDFVPNDKLKIAYAPSIGLDEFPEEYRLKCKSLIKRFDKISVRESSGAVMLKELLGDEVPVLCDPTLLLKAADYDKIASAPSMASRYICVYSMGNEQRVKKALEKLMEQCDLPVMWLVGGHAASWHINRGRIKRISCFGPGEFLGYMKNASFVLTNSFHGTAFSLIFGKPFHVVLNGTASDARMISLLGRLGLDDHARCPESEFLMQDFELYNPKSVSDGLTKLAAEAKAFLGDVLPLHEYGSGNGGVIR